MLKYGVPAAEWIRKLGPRMLKFDFKGYSHKKQWVPIGEGDEDWPEVMEALAEIKYNGWATAEVGGGGEKHLRDISERMDKCFGGEGIVLLTRPLAIAEYDFRRGRLVPDRLTRTAHGKYRGHAEQLLNIYRSGVGRTRRERHRAAAAVFGAEPRLSAAADRRLLQLLDDASEYHRDRKGQAAALRRRVFRFAALRHPLVRQADRLFETEEAAVKTALAYGTRASLA